MFNSKLTILVGLPGSGKSTYADKIKSLEGDDCVIISSDAMRVILFNDINSQQNNELVFKMMKESCKSNLANGKHVIYDATNLIAKHRIAILEFVKGLADTKECIIFATPVEMCVQFDKDRTRTVGEKVIKRMAKTFNVPMYEEGFNLITIMNPNLTSMKRDFESQTLCKTMLNTPQENPHHPNLTIGEHCDNTLLILLKNNINVMKNVAVATLYHDYGKLDCKEYNEEKGYYVYYSHHNYGAYLFLSYIQHTISNEEFTVRDLLEIAFLIENHMLPFFIDIDSKSYNKFIKRYGEKRWNDIMLIHNADILAK